MIEQINVYFEGEAYRVTFNIESMEIYEVVLDEDCRGRVVPLDTLPPDLQEEIQSKMYV